MGSHAFSRHCQCVLCGNVFNSTLELISHKKSEHHKNRGNAGVSKSVHPAPVQKNDESKNIEDQKNRENVRVSKSTIDYAPVQKNAEAESKNIEDQKNRENVRVLKSTVDSAPVQKKAESNDDRERKHPKTGT